MKLGHIRCNMADDIGYDGHSAADVEAQLDSLARSVAGYEQSQCIAPRDQGARRT